MGVEDNLGDFKPGQRLWELYRQDLPFLTALHTTFDDLILQHYLPGLDKSFQARHKIKPEPQECDKHTNEDHSCSHTVTAGLSILAEQERGQGLGDSIAKLFGSNRAWAPVLKVVFTKDEARCEYDQRYADVAAKLKADYDGRLRETYGLRMHLRRLQG